jgi:hypothetical protein
MSLTDTVKGRDTNIALLPLGYVLDDRVFESRKGLGIFPFTST